MIKKKSQNAKLRALFSIEWPENGPPLTGEACKLSDLIWHEGVEQ